MSILLIIVALALLPWAISVALTILTIVLGAILAPIVWVLGSIGLAIEKDIESHKKSVKEKKDFLD